mmetsp:Transcript_20176/g.47030  ORF Transcript_20176/g.47030 Transcript_20176/m.47030 type:complete len:205 (-) Transcript_20176:29-643(-)
MSVPSNSFSPFLISSTSRAPEPSASNSRNRRSVSFRCFSVRASSTFAISSRNFWASSCSLAISASTSTLASPLARVDTLRLLNRCFLSVRASPIGTVRSDMPEMLAAAAPPPTPRGFDAVTTLAGERAGLLLLAVGVAPEVDCAGLTKACEHLLMAKLPALAATIPAAALPRLAVLLFSRPMACKDLRDSLDIMRNLCPCLNSL